MEPRELALKIAWSFLGKPYRWGGNDPLGGFDCSGFIVEILKSTGHMRRGSDLTASGIWDTFDQYKVLDPYPGCLVFWQNVNGAVIHVELCLDNIYSIGASGGGGSTMTMQDAIEQDAYIKIRPFNSRKPVKGFLDVFLASFA